ncbi:thioredoxin family protein [Sabulilitoribacter arenilitoris]|uniref:Thioredoxin family protein n=1 Tax=Wocania arenilitoris TaxID=2044858 RepID=A0AAE3EP16_9FLAO|nr:thioredoxin family protein [Wocania arenilitoris]MCF7568428.1 thioredoxin family protein [Wocania arenilitoris]
MDFIIKNSLDNSMSYSAYRILVQELVEASSTTGLEKTEALVNYTKLNDRRMKRWDKTVNIPDEAKDRILTFEEPVTWLLITESWCGDAAHILPVINKVAELNKNINLRIVLRDENPELMDAFLTNGARAIPKLIVIDNATGGVLTTYGPRPSEATNYVTRFKAKYGALTPSFKEDLQHWYNKDKGQNIIYDLTEILCNLQPTVCQ